MNSDIKRKYVKNPYPGIRSFDVEESHLFFGREKQIQELLDILKRTNFIAITGASGSGKSSLVKAGLIPALINSSNNQDYLIFRPGRGLYNNMAQAFYELFKKNGISNKLIKSTKEIESVLVNGIDSFIEFLQNLGFNKGLILYVDQFEEIFRFRQKESDNEQNRESENFVNLLIALSKCEKFKISVVISLRTDFLSDCTEFPELPDIINEGHYLIPKMTAQEKERAFKGPAKIGGAQLSDELSDVLNKHIAKYNTNLPVLQHSLMRTWDYWLINAEPEEAVGVEHYNAIGTVSDALSVHAEQIYVQLASDEQRKTTEKIFKALTFLGEDNRGTRRPTTLGDICAITGNRQEDVIEVIDVFRAEGNSFLFPTSDIELNDAVVIDISHESIMRIWKRLIDWVREETSSAQLYLRLSKSSELYQLGKTGLLVGPDLLLALRWQKENAPNETWAKRYNPSFDRVINYLQYSDKEQKRIIAVKEKKKQNTMKRTRFFVIFLSAASIISILFLVVALNLQFKAEASEKKAKEKEKLAISESKIAEEKRKEAISQGNIAEQQQLIAEEQKLLAEAQKLFAIAQQNEAIFQKSLALEAHEKAIEARDMAMKLKKQAENLRDEALAQKKEALAQKARAEVSEAKTDTLRRLAIAQALAVNAVKVKGNLDKTQQLTEEQKDLPYILALQAYYFNRNFGGDPNDAEIYNTLSEISGASTLIKGKNAHSDAVRDIEISDNGKNFLSCGEDGSLKLHNIDDTEHPIELKNPTIGKISYRKVLFGENNRIIAGTNKGQIVFWNKEKLNEKPIVNNIHNAVINQILKAPYGNKYYSSSIDGTVKQWEAENISAAKTLFQTNDKIEAIALSSLGNFIAIATQNGTIKYFNTLDFSEQKTIQTQSGEISTMTFTLNDVLIVGYVSGKIELRKDGEIKEFIAHSSAINEIIYDEEISKIITCSYDGTIKVWDTDELDSTAPMIINKHDSWVYSIALTPDRSRIISGSADKNILISNIDIDYLKESIRKKVNQNMSNQNWLKYVGTGIEYSPELPKD